MSTETFLNGLFFFLAALSCFIGVITGIYRLKTSNVKPLHTYAILVLLYLSIIYGMAALARWGRIDTSPLLRVGTLTSIGVFLLSSLFTIMFIVGCKRYGR